MRARLSCGGEASIDLGRKKIYGRGGRERERERLTQTDTQRQRAWDRQRDRQRELWCAACMWRALRRGIDPVFEAGAPLVFGLFPLVATPRSSPRAVPSDFSPPPRCLPNTPNTHPKRRSASTPGWTSSTSVRSAGSIFSLRNFLGADPRRRPPAAETRSTLRTFSDRWRE